MSTPNCATCDNNMSAAVNHTHRTTYENTDYPKVYMPIKSSQHINQYQGRLQQILQAQTAKAQTINNNSPVKHIFR